MPFLLARRCIVAGATLALVGCSEPLGPSDVSGTYVLTRAGSASLPLVVTLGDGSVHRLEADTVVLRADGTGRRHRVEHFLPVGGVELGAGDPVEFTYRLDGRTMHAVVKQSGADLSLQTFHLVMIGDELRYSVFRYERMGAPAP